MRPILLASALLLASCASGPDRRAVLDSLIGQPEVEAVRVLGVPSRSYEASGHKFLAFVQQRQDYLGGGPFFFGGGFYGPGFGYGGFYPPELVERVCETTLDVSGGRVRSWSLRGNLCD